MVISLRFHPLNVGKKGESRGYFGNSPTEKPLQTIVLLGSSPQKFLFFFGSSLKSLFHVCCKRRLNSRIKKINKNKNSNLQFFTWSFSGYKGSTELLELALV